MKSADSQESAFFLFSAVAGSDTDEEIEKLNFVVRKIIPTFATARPLLVLAISKCTIADSQESAFFSLAVVGRARFGESPSVANDENYENVCPRRAESRKIHLLLFRLKQRLR